MEAIADVGIGQDGAIFVLVAAGMIDGPTGLYRPARRRIEQVADLASGGLGERHP
ncbi:hypothetical protein [Geminicoccus roseus]|uniref:hypothetical protein n=1 Tax=Geminicoccus roseus TaxID=404900 RepID=UPI00041FEFBA|nr:hypothetical protein [Geminicoccus roseus]